MHQNNIHNKPYDFIALGKAHPSLKPFIFINKYETTTIDFSNSDAVLHLNKAILKHHYGLVDWNIPDGYLCPPIPGRADYIHHLEDVLKDEHIKEQIQGLDIGVGANCIYPILGTQLYQWNMMGSDIDKNAVLAAKKNVGVNPQFSKRISIRHQPNNADIFAEIIKKDEYFHFTMCNPPFHVSQEEARKGTQRKLKNLGRATKLTLNFGGQANELWCNGGEALFIKRMIKQSKAYANQVGVFTSLVSKKENLPKLIKQLNKLKATHRIIEMAQGNKKSRLIVWKF